LPFILFLSPDAQGVGGGRPAACPPRPGARPRLRPAEVAETSRESLPLLHDNCTVGGTGSPPPWPRVRWGAGHAGVRRAPQRLGAELVGATSAEPLDALPWRGRSLPSDGSSASPPLHGARSAAGHGWELVGGAVCRSPQFWAAAGWLPLPPWSSGVAGRELSLPPWLVARSSPATGQILHLPCCIAF
jgi:hypothetical protein